MTTSGARRRTATRIRRSVLLAIAVLLAAAPAQAAAFLPLGGLLNTVQTIVSGVFPVLKDGTCPLTRKSQVVSTVTCNLDLLSYRWHVKLDRPTGPDTVREVGAVLNVPTLLDVDDDPLPDVVATLVVTSLDTFTVRVDRVLGETSKLPVSVEAIVKDPTRGGLPRPLLHAGFDARDAGAPVSFTTQLRLLKDPRGQRVQLETRQVGARSALTVLGGMFAGTTRNRTDQIGGRLAWGAPVPARTVADAVIGEDYAVDLRTDRAAPLDVTGLFDTGSIQRRARVAVANLPVATGVASLRVNLDEQGEDQRKVELRGAARIAAVTASYEQRLDQRLERSIEADVRDLPAVVEVVQRGPRSATLETEGGAIGEVRAGFGDGRTPVYAAGPGHHVRVLRDATGTSFAARILGLEQADVAAGPHTIAEATLAAGPLRVELDEPGMEVDATVGDLPGRVRLDLDIPGRRLGYDADAVIERIGFGVRTDGAQLGARIRRVDGLLEGLPRRADVHWGPAGGGVAFETSEPIRRVEVLASDGRPVELLPAAQEHLLRLTDTKSEYSFGGRIFGLRRAAFTPGDELQVQAELDRRPLTVRYDGAEGQATARVKDVPGSLALTADLAAGTVDYQASDPIGQIGLDVLRPQPFLGRATRLNAELIGLPAALRVRARPAAGGFEVTASDRVASVALSLTDGPVLAPVGDGHRAVYRDTAERFELGVRLLGLRALSVQPEGSSLALEADLAPSPFGVVLDTDDRRVTATIANLPRSIDLALRPGEVTYAGSDTIGALDASLELRRPDAAPFVGRARKLELALRDLPREVALRYSAPDRGVRLTTDSPIGSVQLVASEGQAVELPGDGHAVRLVDEAGLPFALAARIVGLREVAVSAGEVVRVITKLAPGPIDLRLEQDGILATGSVKDLPAESTLVLDLAQGEVGLDGTQPIAAIDVEASRADRPLFDRATTVRFGARDVPARWSLAVDSEIDAYAFTPSAPVGELIFAARDHGDELLPAEPANGLVVRDDEGRFAVGARLRGLAGFRYGPGTTPGQRVIEARVAPAPLEVDYQSTNEVLTAALPTTPGRVRVTIDPEAGTYAYDADAPIATLLAEYRSRTPFAGRLQAAKLRLTDVPAQVTVTLQPAGDGLQLATDTPVGVVSGAVASGYAAVAELDGDGSGVRVLDTPGTFYAAARLRGLQRAVVATEPLDVDVIAAAGQRFDLDLLRTAVDAVPARVTGSVQDVPARFRLHRTATDRTDAITYDASAPIGRIELDASGLPGIGAGARPLNARVRLTRVPARWHLQLPVAADGGRVASFDTFGAGIGLVEAEAWNDGARYPQVFVDTARAELDGARLHALLRIKELGRVSAQLERKQTFQVGYVAKPTRLEADVVADGKRIAVQIQEPPRTVQLEIPTNYQRMVEYTASDPIPLLQLQAVLPGSAVIDVQLQDLPTRFTVCMRDTGICPVQSGYFPQHQKLGVYLSTNHVQGRQMILDGRVCTQVQAGHAFDLDGCRTAPRRYLRVVRLFFDDLRFEFGSGAGDNLYVTADTGANGIRATHVFWHDPEFKVSHGFYFSKTGTPLRANGLGLTIDETVVPTIDDSIGSIDCAGGRFKVGPLTGIEADTGEPIFDDLGEIVDAALCDD